MANRDRSKQLHAGWARRQRSLLQQLCAESGWHRRRSAALFAGLRPSRNSNLQSQFSTEYGRNSGLRWSTSSLALAPTGLHGFRISIFSGTAASTHATFSTFETAEIGIPNKQLRRRLLGGPSSRQDFFFFGAYEGERERVGSDFLLLVSDPSEISQAPIHRTNSQRWRDQIPALDRHSRFLSTEQHETPWPVSVNDQE